MILKKHTKSIIIWVVLIAITILMALCTFFITHGSKSSENNNGIQANAGVSSTQAASSDTAAEGDNASSSGQGDEDIKKSLSILGVGDNLIHTAIYSQANRRAGGAGYDFSYAYKEVADTISNADIASINQETVMASIYEPSTYPMFNSPTQLGDEMLDIGFDVFNLANNHVADKGEKGMLSYFDYWQQRPQAITTGAYRDNDDYNNIRLVEKSGLLVSFIGMTEFTNGLSFPESSDIVLLRTSQKDKIKERIQKAKAISDIVVINVHWGVEYSNEPTQSQKALAQSMIEWGADVIFGHHPHVIQPIEYIERADGSVGVVCYSLGNFISAQSQAPRTIGGMLSVEFDISDEVKPYISKVEFIPIITQYEAGYKDVRIIPFSDYSSELALAHGVRKNNPEYSFEYIDQYIRNVVDENFLNF